MSCAQHVLVTRQRLPREHVATRPLSSEMSRARRESTEDRGPVWDLRSVVQHDLDENPASTSHRPGVPSVVSLTGQRGSRGHDAESARGWLSSGAQVAMGT